MTMSIFMIFTSNKLYDAYLLQKGVICGTHFFKMYECTLEMLSQILVEMKL